MPDNLMTWWGTLRRRSYPYDSAPPVLARVAAGLLAGLALTLVWFLILLVPSAYNLVITYLGRLTAVLVLPLLITVVVLFSIALVAPLTRHKGKLFGILLLIGEKGHLRRYDLVLGIVGGAIVFAGIVAEIDLPVLCAGLVSAALLFLCGIALHLSAETHLVPTRWPLNIPEWLEQTQTEKEKEFDAEQFDLFEEGAAPVLSFVPVPDSDEKAYRVGVRISDAVLGNLREINGSTNGRLYLDNAEAVVLSEGEPVDGAGAEEVIRLAQQLARVRDAKAMTPYALASSILRMIQVEIDYEHDKERTACEKYGRFPLETLADGKGGRECTSILCAALLARSGLPCALLFVKVAEKQHVAVGLEYSASLFGADLATADRESLILDEETGLRYFYGMTATDDPYEPLGFGVIPTEWRSTLEVLRVVRIVPSQQMDRDLGRQSTSLGNSSSVVVS